ncbi:MAG: bifunctional 5,10-methylenetetrahydrofolate dehydrogenase/5,10-methenyltetrahydrofolate cyclohydrolase [Chloroflexaceae bacterium]|nr:bifunctional 5,10-methylenetetrahydrofolate dehydrogenase/5,10-methenyltetrahydrofolate cyclohydrolase [Chloroflexaceae bacterium]
MTATILDGRAVSRTVQAEVQAEVQAFGAQYGISPCLAVVQVQGDDASERYARTIQKRCETVGVAFRLEQLRVDVSQEVLNATIGALSADDEVHGILLQMPLPAALSSDDAVRHLDYTKDVDGIHPVNAGLLSLGRPALVPGTPAGGMELLQRYDIPLAGRYAAVVGRSAIVGRPMAALLVQANATVTVCHSKTPDLGRVLRSCEIVAVAVGRAGIVTGDMIAPGAVVIDFGINVLADGNMVGDVDAASVGEVAGALTPVPGGTGPMTNVMLLRNVLIAARRQEETRS